MTSHAAEIRNLEETAKFFGISVPTLKSWVDRGCPVVKRGGNGVAWEFELHAAAEWLRGERKREEDDAVFSAERDSQLKFDLLGQDTLPDPYGGGSASMTAKARAEALRAELDKVKLAQMRRELVRADDVRDDLSQVMALVRDRLRTLPDDLGRRYGLDGDQVEDCVEMVDDLLNSLADSIDGLTSLKSDRDDE
ncbi:hypothetical protein H261_03283 [Paramagnetospirillum caucaseum]|uniref:Terminase small subunit n=1 Tax=Paramagnetospirillum caucaseum TaxID=1244869 RepID=M3AFP9_9PROT|nr:DUF1441 family protein [Paramagnetospirillum caucaseum]EME71399.1 hypothetical protein H261_03283 [Paramagnetospirillum caucaseum]